MAGKKIQDIEGIGPTYGEKLEKAGIKDTDTLLKSAKTKKGRTDLAAKTGITESLILKWANMADLYRINGVGSEFSELLERAGVDTVKELATRNATNIAKKLSEVNTELKLTRRVPTETEVADWIAQAKKLPTGLEY